MRSRPSTPPRAHGFDPDHRGGSTSTSTSSTSLHYPQDVTVSPRRQRARLAELQVGAGITTLERRLAKEESGRAPGYGHGLGAEQREASPSSRRRRQGEAGQSVPRLMQSVVSAATRGLRSSRRRSILVIALLLTIFGWYTFLDGPTQEPSKLGSTASPGLAHASRRVLEENVPPLSKLGRPARKRVSKKDTPRSPSNGKHTPDVNVWKHAFQDSLPRRSDHLSPAKEWTEEDRQARTEGLKKLRRIMPERWPAGENGGVEHGYGGLEGHVPGEEDSAGGAKSGGITVAPRGSALGKQASYDSFDRLIACLAETDGSTCTPEETEIVVLASSHFTIALATAREDISSDPVLWARSIIDSFTRLGYTILYADGLLEILDIHTAIPDMVRVIITDPATNALCEQWGVLAFEEPLYEEDIAAGAKVTELQVFTSTGSLVDAMRNPSRAAVIEAQKELRLGQTIQAIGHIALPGQVFSESRDKLKLGHDDYEVHEEYKCVKGPRFAHGIPPWKLFALQTAGLTTNDPKRGGLRVGEEGAMLGHLWTLAPDERGRGNEEGKGNQGWEENYFLGYSLESGAYHKDRNDEAFLLAHDLSDFEKRSYKYPDNAFQNLASNHAMQFVAPLDPLIESPRDAGITTIGSLSKQAYIGRLGRSKILVDIGAPSSSSIPYIGLSMGVPYINQVTRWARPEAKRNWVYRHEGLAGLEPPYVYTVLHGNETQLRDAVQGALENPTQPYILPEMTVDAVTRRHEALMGIDWETLAKQRVDDMNLYGQEVVSDQFRLNLDFSD